MKKYLQYNSSHFRDPKSDVGVNRSHRFPPEGCPNEARGPLALDLSGRPTANSVAKVTDQKGANEQDAALDLSRYGRQEAQEEALDLTKPNTSRPDRPSSQSYQQTQSVNQSHRTLHTPPVSRHSKSPAAQPYSLLQAALNSNQPNAGLHTVFDRICQSTAAMLEQRSMVFPTPGMPADYGRTIKPFSCLSSRPLGITRPHMSHPAGAVIQGMHKPIAITAPQPHNSSVNTKSQSVSEATVSVTDANHSISSTCNQSYLVSQSNYSSALHSQISRQLNSGKMGITDALKHSSDSLKDPNMVERYLIQPPQGLNHFVGNVNVIPTEALAGFSCNQCSKAFKTKAALKLHTTVHKTAEERQYACTICSRRFLHRHHLVVHQRKHSGEKPFKCTACSKTFMAIFLLHKHLRKHARETGPVSVISTEQLKQLHDNKLVPAQKAAPVVIKEPVTSENNPVIVLDDDDDVKATAERKATEEEGKLDRKRYERHKNQSILDIIEPSMILEKLKADLIKNNSENVNKIKDEKVNEVKAHLTNDSKLDNKCDAEKPVTNSEETINPQTEETAVSPNGEMHQEDIDIHIKSEDVDNTYNYIIKDNDEPKENFEESEMRVNEVMEENIKTEVKMDETEKPFPEYGSDDEVELDFTTGEMKVLGKKTLEESKSTEDTKEIEMKENKQEDLKLEESADNYKTKEGHEHSLDEEGDKKGMEVKSEMETEDTKMSEHKGDEKDLETEFSESSIEHEIAKENEKKLEKEQETALENSAQSYTLNGEAYHKTDKKKKEHESGNIFEKFSEMKDEVKITRCCNVKESSLADDANKVDKEVENILGLIKQKLCESEEEFGIVTKKPKLDVCNVSKIDTEANERAKNKSDITELAKHTSPKHSRHRKGKKKGKKVKCEICSRTFHSNHYLVLHMAVHKRNPMLQVLRKAKDYQMKAMGFLNKTNVTCEICKKVFKFQKSLNSHMRVHSEKMIQTKLYRKAFRDFMAEAAPHSARTSDKEKSQTQTSESESQVRRFSAGEQITDKGKEITSSMKRVSSDFENINMLNDEQYDDPPIKVIIGEDNVKRYLCHACDNTYTTRQKLRMHALIHKDNCYLCDVCGKSFFRHVTLEKHISTHMLPRPHICEVCKKSFIHRSSLMRHKVVHEKPAATTVKQQVADLNFEMKMLDTYSMLRHERMQKMQIQQLLDAARTEPVSVKVGEKYDPLDLTVRIKSEDHTLPPVLSPVSASVPTATQVSPWNLSPPLITHETNNELCIKSPDKNNVTKSNENELKAGDFESVRPLDVREAHKCRTESTCSESDVVAVEGHQVVKKRSRKTRVYQTSCRVCKEVFPNVMLLKSHMVVHNTVETHLYECHICRHRFTQSCSLLRHLKTSCQENRMKCVPCGRTFHRRNTFDQHMRLHQGGLPNLDGSFYDKRPDEAEVIEERESDIENNNLSKIEEAFINQENNMTPLREELVNLIGKETANNLTIIKQGEGNESDSDARTYLYSEGEVHSRYNSDFSDNDWSPPQSPKKITVPQDLSVTSGNMTLNLLSAVCSDIRNAEKEQELKRKELEEKQKELETIEILANLKRGAMQKSYNSATSVANVHQVSTPTYIPINDKVTNSANAQSESVGATDGGHSQFKSNDLVLSQTKYSKHLTDGNKSNVQHSAETFGQVTGSSHLHSEPKQSSSFPVNQSPKLPSVIEGSSTSTGEPKIPTVVLEVAAEAERHRRQRVESTWQDRSHGHLSTGSPHVAVSGPHSEPIIPHSAPVIPYSSAWNPHLAPSVPHSAPVFQHSSARSPHFSPFNSHPSARSPHPSAKSPHSSASSSLPSPGSLHFHGRSPHSTSIEHSPGSDPRPSRDTTLQHEMSQMKVHYPAIQERLSLLMKAQVTTASGSSQSASAQNLRPLDALSSISDSTFNRALQSNITLTAKNSQHTDTDIPEDLSLKKTSQETTSAHTMPGSRLLHSRSLSTEIMRPSHMESKQLEMLRSFPQGMPLPLTHEKKKSESLKSLPSEISKQLLVESKSDIPRSDSSRSLPSEVPSSADNERKRSESVPVQPPLVPMHQCELCSRVLYNRHDLHLHMVEHGRSAGELYKLLHSNKTLLEQKRHPVESPLDFTKAGPSNGFGHSSKDSKVSPPISLDLSSKKSENKMKAFNHSAVKTPEHSPGAQSKLFALSGHRIAEKSSPMSSSDQSDSLSSPSTPSGSGQSAANLDALRQELRLKIFSRRRSQGLDDLKVEFKSPEPTEMTESEKLKLMYRRECNRQAAQRSRMRKKDLVDSLLEDLHKEEVVHSDLQRKMEALVAEKNFLVKVFKSHECVKGLVKPTENHSLFEALNHKEDVVIKENSDEKRVDILAPSLNLEDHSDASGSTVGKNSCNTVTETHAYVEESFKASKEMSISEWEIGSSTNTQEDKSSNEDNVEEDEYDRFHDNSSIAEHSDDSSEMSDDTDSPILKLLTDTSVNYRDRKGSGSSLIKDNVDDT